MTANAVFVCCEYKLRYGCRTQLGFDRHGSGYTHVGRGNIAPTTIILPMIALEYGIATGERKTADLDGFWNEFERILIVTRESLINRYAHVVSQSPKSAPFMYDNKTVLGANNKDRTVVEALKHGTLAIGFIGIAETCQALFGENQIKSQETYDYALKIVKRIYDFASESSDKYNLNFSCYATPSEGLCYTAANIIKSKYGELPNISDRKYITNSSHVPVWENVTIYNKLGFERPFTKYETGGCITYVEVDSKLSKNPDGVEKLIDTAMEMDIPYLAINFPIDTCLSCGYQDEIKDICPICGGGEIEHLGRVTGYLTSDVSHFNAGKRAEFEDRVKHTVSDDFGNGGV